MLAYACLASLLMRALLHAQPDSAPRRCTLLAVSTVVPVPRSAARWLDTHLPRGWDNDIVMQQGRHGMRRETSARCSAACGPAPARRGPKARVVGKVYIHNTK